MFRRPLVMATAAAVTLSLCGASITAKGVLASNATSAKQAPKVGTGNTGAPRTVTVSSLPDAPATASSGNSSNLGTLYQDGSRVNTYHQAASKPAAPSSPSTALQPTRVLENFAGTLASQSSCGCQPPDSNGAVSSKNIVETTNLASRTRESSTTTPGIDGF